MNRETDIHNAVLLALSKRFHPHGVFWRQNAGRVRTERGVFVSLGPTGISDVVGLVLGMPVFVEVKTDKGTQRKGQKAFQVAVEKAGGLYLVARSADQAVAGVIEGLRARGLVPATPL